MKEEVLRCLLIRRSVRAYEPRQITEDELEAVLQAGLYAPCGMGSQKVYFAAVQDKAVRAIGSTEMVPVDVRIISATNRDLAGMVQNGTFRLDLYYRLNVIELKIPPLRQRRDEIPLLAYRFLQEFNERYGTNKEFSPEVIESFRAYPWPGNIRELRHVVESLVVLGPEQIISPEHLPGEFRENQMAKRTTLSSYGDAGLKSILGIQSSVSVGFSSRILDRGSSASIARFTLPFQEAKSLLNMPMP